MVELVEVQVELLVGLEELVQELLLQVPSLTAQEIVAAAVESRPHRHLVSRGMRSQSEVLLQVDRRRLPRQVVVLQSVPSQLELAVRSLRCVCIHLELEYVEGRCRSQVGNEGMTKAHCAESSLRR